MDVNRQSNENFIDYCDRLINAKENNLIDIDKSEIWELMTGEKLSSEESRKRIYSLKTIIKILRQENETNISEDAIIKRIVIERQRLEEEKVKMKDQRRELNKLIAEKARFEHIKDCIQETAALISKEKVLSWKQPAYIVGDKEGVLLLSDWHSENEVDNFLNKFNKTEFLRRIDRLVMKTIEYGKLHNIYKLHVINLGDLLSGIIHIITRIANSEDVVTQTQFISELLAEILCKFANEFEEVKFYNVLDNHSRVMPDKKESIDKESFVRFIPWYLETRLKDVKNIEIVKNELDDDIAILNICGFTAFSVHGHKDNVKSVVQNLSLMTRIFPDYIFTSHFHHNIEDEIHSCEVIVNPSLIGTDNYSKDLRRSSKPAQKFMIFNPEEGRECSYNIRLDI